MPVHEPDQYTYPRYLSAKATVDDRALNQHVWGQFLDALTTDSSGTIQLLEVGGGVGATAQRIVEALETRSVESVQYTLVDLEPQNIQAAASSLREWAEACGYSVSGQNVQQWRGEALNVELQLITADLFEAAGHVDRGSLDAVVGQAVLDIIDAPQALRTLRPPLRPGGLWYLPIHFDGMTTFEPTLDASLDATIERLYHDSMARSGDEEGGADGAQCGRRLLTTLQDQGDTLLAAGASDWVVFGQNGKYPADEAYFLHHILHFVEEELSNSPDLAPDRFGDWLMKRRRQVANGELIYIAHQLDVLAQTTACKDAE